MNNFDYDAVVVGSGPNGMAAAITMQRAGLSVLLLEGKATIGGGLRSETLTLPGFIHDVCSAIHPLAVSSHFFRSLPLNFHGLDFIYPEISAAHPFDNGTAAILAHDINHTAKLLGIDQQAYLDLINPIVHNWPKLAFDLLGPLKFPKHPFIFSDFGLKAISSASFLVKRFKSKEARGLWAGMAAHSIQPLSNLATSAIGLVLMAAGHLHGWPIPRGGSQSIANAMASYFVSLGGKIERNFYVSSLSQIPSSRAILLDVTPKQLLEIAGHKFSFLYKNQLKRYKYGMGVFKMDWALDGPIPFASEECSKAATVHLGNSFEEIAEAEKHTWNGRHPQKPFVLLSQASKFDSSRAPSGKHTVWAYCHVPNSSTVDMSNAIENQIERFAPGFKDRILAKNVMNTAHMEAHNPNYIGGDINGGVINLSQLFTRPALRLSPYRTSAKGIYICSSSTPPGAGVHGMCGYHSACQALRDIFKMKLSALTSY